MWYTTGLLCGLLLALLARSPHAAVDCDGVDDRLTTGGTLATFITASAFTVAGWVKAQSTPATTSECYNASVITGDADGGFSLGRRAPTIFCTQLFDPGSHHLAGTASPGWHHLAVSLGGGTVTLYVDGSVAASEPMNPLADLSFAVTLCGIPSGHTADRLADVRYYATTVPAAEIEWIAKSRQRGAGQTVPSAYWPLDDCADGASGNGVSFKDRSGNVRHATGTNGGGTCRAAEYLSRPMPIQ